jgi:hypothetical protein
MEGSGARYRSGLVQINTDPDLDAGCPKTYGCGSGTLVKKYKKIAGIWTN